ncbi:putative 54S ribosomal protein L17, mitochondrial [Geopyxis carbonaria]|nr:putative 54S ribosomal protein L17, mitochondrial [Geopyxis carbonaria]
MNVGTQSMRPLGLLLHAAAAVATSPYRIASSVVLSRAPLLTRDLDAFEESYYFYQRRLNQRLALPFTRYFYFKKDSPGDLEWKAKQKKRGGDVYTGFGARGWADELVVGDETHKEKDFGYQRLVETTVSGEDVEDEKRVLDRPFPRETEADKTGDTARLDRKLQRTLYLLVQGKEAGWTFPTALLQGRENLRESAERTLAEAAGVNMNTWFVGNVPIGHYVRAYDGGADAEGMVGEKVFFMKARIMAGQADLGAGTLGYTGFQWLTKDEIEGVAGKRYFNKVRHMLAER